MPISALFLLMMGAGGFLVYTAVKGSTGPGGGHPITAFKSVLAGGEPSNAPGTPGGPSLTTAPGTPAGSLGPLGLAPAN